MKPVFLVGTSAVRRREIAASHFAKEYTIEYRSPDIDERQIRSNDPYDLTEQIANAKMDAILGLVNNDESLSRSFSETGGGVVVTFDQVVVWNGEIREKPESKEQALQYIRSYSGNSVSTVQSTCVYNFNSRKRVSASNRTLTSYYEIPEEAIVELVEDGACFSAAGAFVVEHPIMKRYRKAIEVGDEEEVQGFSARVVRELLQKL